MMQKNGCSLLLQKSRQASPEWSLKIQDGGTPHTFGDNFYNHFV
jgi:hypothetical protein